MDSGRYRKKSGRGRASGNAGSVYGVKKLRELILELAVRGKLVPQDPNDEPASELLKRIQAEKAKLIAEGKLKKQKPLAPISEDEKSFELPKGWVRAFITQVVSNDKYSIKRGPFGSAIKKDYFVNEGFKVYEQQHAINDNFYLGHYYIDKSKFEELSAFEVKANDIIISCSGTVGRVAIAPSDMEAGIINQALLKITLNESVLINTYFKILFPAFYMKTDKLSDLSGTAQKNIVSVDELKNEPFPLPPLAEQHRIVAKVDELMALCDQLEQQHSNAQEAHETLVSQLLATLTQSQNTADFNANWQRIYTHFDVLFTTEASIDALKQTLLQLAVKGKLVSQDPDDEPASELLTRIHAEKAKLIAEGKLKKEKPLAPITEDEKSYKIPTGWSWIRLNELLTKIGAGSTPLGGKQVYVKEGVPFLRSQNVWDDGLRLDDVALITSDTHKKMSGTQVYSGDLLFNITGASIGRCAIVPDSFVTGNVSQHVTIIRLASNQILRFMHLVLISQHVQQTVMDVQVGVSREGLSIGKLGQFVIPIPPLAEQQRIVAKVDALMALCDQLKTRIQQANQQQQAIADALVAQAVA